MKISKILTDSCRYISIKKPDCFRVLMYAQILLGCWHILFISKTNKKFFKFLCKKILTVFFFGSVEGIRRCKIGSILPKIRNFL